MSSVFVNMLLTTIEKSPTEPEIRKSAAELRSLSMFNRLSDSEYNEAIDLAIRTISISVGESHVIETMEHTPWFESYYKDLDKATRWDRYKDYLLYKKHFPNKVIQSMKNNLFKITDLLGNPNGVNFKRKGLIVGDVQSGKTASYIGLMNLATDANYKVIIVLTGTTNTLREQTQLRIEEGLGIGKGHSGVNEILNAQYNFTDPIYLTSVSDDFRTSTKKNFQLSIEATNVPIVLVTKKNSSSLKNIYSWLIEYSKNKNADYIDSSLLLIDDEADFASVNTKDEDEKPTAINGRIRNILELFTKSSYIGFTATPYANIFIDPADDNEMYGQDLFPRDYIYVLGESDEYVGVQSIFSDDEQIANNHRMLVTINPDEVETYLPIKHKKDDPFEHLPRSMKEAINLFLIANVIRDMRGDNNTHRSMLINISRFMTLHEKIKISVSDYLEKIQRDIRVNGKLPYDEALKIKSISFLRETFFKYYAEKLDETLSFQDILFQMNHSIYNIKVGIINSSSKDVDYILHEKTGERIIIIGGFSLSRGLTLEGLIISYYYRNSVMYDSLLQMGRWFGYRNGYADLCKVFMTPKVIKDFKFIALATQELKDDLSSKSRQGLTPKQFGIKVRSGQAGLIITARNKMRTGEKITAQVDFSKDIIETTTISTLEGNSNHHNNQMIKKIVHDNKMRIVNDMYPSNKKNSFGIRGINKLEIIEFIDNFKSDTHNSNFDSELIIKWLRTNDSRKLEKWDIAFVTGEKINPKFDYSCGVTGHSSVRSMVRQFGNSDYRGIYKNGNSRLGSPTDGAYGLNRAQLDSLKQRNKNKKTISQKEYFDQSTDHRPILLIYSVIPKIDGITFSKVEPIPMISLGIPDLGIGKSKHVQYEVNSIYLDSENVEVSDE